MKLISLSQCVIAIVFTLVGLIIHIWLVSTAFIFLRSNNVVQYQYQEMRIQMQQFMSFKRLPRRIQQRALTHYDYSFQGKFYGKRRVEGTLEKKLQSAVKMERYKRFLQEHYLFKELPEDLLILAADSIVETLFSANDVVSKSDFTRTQVS